MYIIIYKIGREGERRDDVEKADVGKRGRRI